MLVEVIFQYGFHDSYEKKFAMKRVSKNKLNLERTRKALMLEN